MGFDVGQWVVTPRGPATVSAVRRQYVYTTAGCFAPDDISPWVDVEALRDPDRLEAWLEQDDDEPPAHQVTVEARLCGCGCKHCSYLVHLNASGMVVKRFEHSDASSWECQCRARNCHCLGPEERRTATSSLKLTWKPSQ